MESNYITDTQGRLAGILNTITDNAIENKVPQKIDKALSDVNVMTGRILKFYPYIDKAQVQMDFTGKKVLCKILHRFGGDLMEFFTPLSSEIDFDPKLCEPYIIPKASQNVLVIKIKDSDSTENLVLGYYLNEALVGLNPAKPGNIKLMTPREDGNEYWLKFGVDGFNYKIPSAPNVTVGDKWSEKGVEEVGVVHSNDVYTREEIDELISVYEDRIKVLEEKIETLTTLNTDGVNGTGDDNTDTPTDNNTDNGE